MKKNKKNTDKSAEHCESQPPKVKSHFIFETDIDKKSGFVKVFQLVLPVALAVGFIIYTYFYFNDQTRVLGLVAAYYVPPSGKESIIPFATSIGIRPLAIALAITANDVLFSLFLIWNISYVRKVPYIGKALIYTETKGRLLAERYTVFKNLEFFGLIVFIAFPFKGSGGIVGTLVGLIMGMNPYKILAAMFVGTFASSLLLAYSSEYIWDLVPLSLPEIWLIIIIFIEVLVLIRMVYGQFYKKSEFYKHRNGDDCK